MPATRDVYHVTTSVRQRETKTLPVQNQSTSVTYNLRPVIDGTEHFNGPETLVVPPSSTRTYELTYQPLSMTTDGKKHTVCCCKVLTLLLYELTYEPLTMTTDGKKNTVCCCKVLTLLLYELTYQPLSMTTDGKKHTVCCCKVLTLLLFFLVICRVICPLTVKHAHDLMILLWVFSPRCRKVIKCHMAKVNRRPVAVWFSTFHYFLHLHIFCSFCSFWS